MVKIYIYPLNTIYAYNKTYVSPKEHIALTVEKTLAVVPYVEKFFLEILQKFGYKIQFVGLDEDQVGLIKKETSALGLERYISDIVVISNIESQSILISEDVLHGNIKDDCLFFLSVLIFKPTVSSEELVKSNIDNFDKLKPDFMFESPRQSINILEHLIKTEDGGLHVRLNNYLSKALRVLYFFDVENFRKREVVVTTNEIHYIPFLTKKYGDFDIYGKVDLFLQRCPYFYLDNKKRCMEIQESLDQAGIVVLHNFNVIENVFYRCKVLTYIDSFIEKVGEVIKEKYGVVLKVPNSKELDIQADDSRATIRSKLIDISNAINYPYIIKPDPCSEHSLFLIISEEGLHKFLDDEKLYKYNKYLVQEFIPHDGLMFKNYYLNHKSLSIVRPSIPNLEGKNLEIKHFEDKCMKFHNEYLYAKEDQSFFGNIEINNDVTKLINYELFDHLAKLFYEIQGLSLFGLDYLYDHKSSSYYILEVNYFPSYREFGSSLQTEFNNHVISYYKSKNN
jgi:hypothetical protein